MDKFNVADRMNNPRYNVAEVRTYLSHESLDNFYIFGETDESLAIALATETTEKNSRLHDNPLVQNREGSLSLPINTMPEAGNRVLDILQAAGLLGEVNEEYQLLIVFSFKGVDDVGETKPFAMMMNTKSAISQIGGDAHEECIFESTATSSGNILRGMVELAAHDPTTDTFTKDAFVHRPDLTIQDIFTTARA